MKIITAFQGFLVIKCGSIFDMLYCTKPCRINIKPMLNPVTGFLKGALVEYKKKINWTEHRIG